MLQLYLEIPQGQNEEGIRWGTPHRHPLETFLALISHYLSTEMWPASYSTEKTEKQASKPGRQSFCQKAMETQMWKGLSPPGARMGLGRLSVSFTQLS